MTTTTSLSSPAPPVVVVGDSERLAQVAHNLVRNDVGAHAARHRCDRLDRRGTAHGVHQGLRQRARNPAEVASRVFDRFYQGDPSRSAKGTGLGLAIVWAIAEALHGTAEVMSATGMGATLVVKIPLAATHVEAAVPEQSSAACPVTAAALSHPARRPR